MMPYDIFNSYVVQFGESVDILNRTPQTSDTGNILRDEDGTVLFDEETITGIQCRIANNRGSEVSKMRFMGAYPTLEEADAVGLFKLSDAPYIRKGNSVTLNRNLSYTFEMLNPVEKKTHIEVTLKRNNE